LVESPRAEETDMTAAKGFVVPAGAPVGGRRRSPHRLSKIKNFPLPALPHTRNKTISYSLHILGVPWQIFAEKIFLIQDTPNQ